MHLEPAITVTGGGIMDGFSTLDAALAAIGTAGAGNFTVNIRNTDVYFTSNMTLTPGTHLSFNATDDPVTITRSGAIGGGFTIGAANTSLTLNTGVTLVDAVVNPIPIHFVLTQGGGRFEMHGASAVQGSGSSGASVMVMAGSVMYMVATSDGTPVISGAARDGIYVQSAGAVVNMLGGHIHSNGWSSIRVSRGAALNIMDGTLAEGMPPYYALYVDDLSTAQRGTFAGGVPTGTFTSLDDLTPVPGTIVVVNGVLQP
jgi:hypothetical protein